MKLLLVALLVAALPAQAARRVPRKAAARVRPEDDPRKKGNDKAFARARIVFDAPDDRAELPAGDAVVALTVTGYALGNGPHAHLIVDGEPALQLDRDGAYVIHGLAPGPHVVRAVLCRPWHEVLKARHAFALARFWLGPRLTGKAGKAAEYVAWPDPRKPLLTYVLPLGHSSPALELWREDGHVVPASSGSDRPLLDFYLSGTKLARRGSKVRLVLDRRELPLLTDWKPLFLRHARPGPHRLTIDLLDRRGRKSPNPLNRTDRTFVAK